MGAEMGERKELRTRNKREGIAMPGLVVFVLGLLWLRINWEENGFSPREGGMGRKGMELEEERDALAAQDLSRGREVRSLRGMTRPSPVRLPIWRRRLLCPKRPLDNR